LATTKQQILHEAIRLPEHEREWLADELFASIGESDRAAIDEAWRDEIRRRVKAMDLGEGSSKSVEEVVARLRRKR
jgi:putative addiction module component (TIGR02574 family)